MNDQLEKAFNHCRENRTSSFETILHDDELGKIMLELKHSSLWDSILRVHAKSSLSQTDLPDHEFRCCSFFFEKLKIDTANRLKEFIEHFNRDVEVMREYGFENVDFNIFKNESIWLQHRRSFFDDPKTLIWSPNCCHEAHSNDLVVALGSFGKLNLANFQLLPPKLRDLINMKDLKTVPVENIL